MLNKIDKLTSKEDKLDTIIHKLNEIKDKLDQLNDPFEVEKIPEVYTIVDTSGSTSTYRFVDGKYCEI